VQQTGPNKSFWGFLTQKVNEVGWEAKTEQQLIYCTESKMKEFHKHFVEGLLEGVMAKVKWKGENGIYFLSK
jgi:hypothetical protein